MKFYPSDWRADPKLRMCSIGARGLWMEMICVMHEAEPYGFLVSNERSVTSRQLAALAGISQGECMKYLLELASAGVYSIDENKRIYSRRMVRDKAKADRDRENGKGGGNPKLKGSVKEGVNPLDKAQKPDTRSQRPEEKDSRASALVDDDWPADFRERFWNAYPRKVGKAAAIRKLETVRKAGQVTFDALMSGVKRYAIACQQTDPKYIKHPERWLNAGCWDDEPMGNAHVAPAARGGITAAIDQLVKIAEQRAEAATNGDPGSFESDAEIVGLLPVG
jgi:hypothetical protein